jgi:hypothetical protein
MTEVFVERIGRSGIPHFADFVRDDGVFFGGGTQDAGLKARRYNGKKTQDSPFAEGGQSGAPRGREKSKSLALLGMTVFSAIGLGDYAFADGVED